MPLKMGHHWHISETPLKWRFAGVSIMGEREREGEGEGERERERERERETAQCLHTNLLFWLGFLEYRKSVNQSCYKVLLSMRTPNTNVSCASAFVRQSRTFHSIKALRTFYQMHTFLN